MRRNGPIPTVSARVQRNASAVAFFPRAVVVNERENLFYPAASRASGLLIQTSCGTRSGLVVFPDEPLGASRRVTYTQVGRLGSSCRASRRRVGPTRPSALQSYSSPSEVEDLGCVSRFTRITGRNCVVVRRGGEHRKGANRPQAMNTIQRPCEDEPVRDWRSPAGQPAVIVCEQRRHPVIPWVWVVAAGLQRVLQ